MRTADTQVQQPQPKAFLDCARTRALRQGKAAYTCCVRQAIIGRPLAAASRDGHTPMVVQPTLAVPRYARAVAIRRLPPDLQASWRVRL
jgi:hypothetical protein